MTFSESFWRVVTDFFTSKLRSERRSRVSLVWNIFRSEEFRCQFTWPKSQHWWLVSLFVKLAVKLILVCVSRRFRTSSLKACGQLKVNCVQLTVHFVYRLVSSYVSGGPWMSVKCNHPIRSPNSTLEFCWCQFFVCRDRGNKQFTSLKFPCIRRHQNSLFSSQSVLRWRDSVAVSWLWLDCVFSVGFLLLFRRHAVRTKRGKNASILYSIALNVTSINLLNIDIFS